MATAPTNPAAGNMTPPSQSAAVLINLVRATTIGPAAPASPVQNVNGVPSMPVYSPTRGMENFPYTKIDVQYCNITFMPLCENFSQEELRLAGYGTSTVKGIYRPQDAKGICFNKPFSGLAPIHIPECQRQFGRPITLPSYGASNTNLCADIVHFDVGGLDGTASQRFAMHEGLVSSASEFVRLALRGEWREADQRVIPLPEDEPVVFNEYQTWLYSRRISPFSTLEKLVKCYILADKLMDVEFRDAVMDYVLVHIRSTTSFAPSLANLVYGSTPEGSPLRRLMCEVFVWCGNTEWIDENTSGELLADMAKLQLTFWRGQRPERMPFLDDPTAYRCKVDKASGE
ncbi:hypothetical protein LTR56_022474 [Elasticomyces elasticus]|nr:hypothetical protein LTR22_025095 [Elasticomyces elasticus]KAK3621964.1 hypothetical protein LTR56_022474 [Elasticomyces elasticus]KAK4908336.1 hypothetical protein LTR49_022752 [Elasticomyces elasticus]KAK5748361.1 hypothetical protein LTS12_021580 [Elasticomyces elasticus]